MKFYPSVDKILNMVLNSTVVSKNFAKKSEMQKSPNLMIDTLNFNNQDLQDFIKISEDVERITRKRRSQRRRSKLQASTLTATLMREEIFESTSIDDDQFLNAMEHETSYNTEKNTIENIMKYFDEDVNVKDESKRAAPTKTCPKVKVASAVALLRSKFGLSALSTSKKDTQHSTGKSNIKDLKNSYENCSAINNGPAEKIVYPKSPRLARKNKVKQMASLFNNKVNSMTRNYSPEPQSSNPSSPSGMESISSPTFTSTLKLNSPKVKTKFPRFVSRSPIAKPKSPFFKRKQLEKSSSKVSLIESPVAKRKQLQKQLNTTCLAAESVFSQLSVKDKALLYNKFIADLTKENPKFIKKAKELEYNVQKLMQRGEVVIEKQNSVKYLRDRFEAKITLSKTLERSTTRPRPKLSLGLGIKAKEYEDTLQSNKSDELVQDDLEDLLHVSTLTVVLKPPSKSKTLPGKNKNQLLQSEPPNKRTQSMMRSSFPVEPFAPPKKIRRTLHERLAPEIIFQNPYLEDLFYYWLNEKNGTAFEIIRVNADNIVEPLKRNATKSEAAKDKTDLDKLKNVIKDKGLALIKNTIEQKRSSEDTSIVEVELPLEAEIPNTAIRESITEDSDLDLASATKTTSDDCLSEGKLDKDPNASLKPLRKKKLRRKENSLIVFSTDSDSDFKKNTLKSPGYTTLPKSEKCFSHERKSMFKATNITAPSGQPLILNNKSNMFDLNTSLIRQVNSPSKIKSAYTLTTISSPSPASGSDFNESNLSKNASRSWPSLYEVDWDSGINLLTRKFQGSVFTSFTNSSAKPERLSMDSFVDQGFETGYNDTASSLGLSRRPDYSINKSHIAPENPKSFSTPFKHNSFQQVFNAPTAANQCHLVSPISYNSSPRKPASVNMKIIKHNAIASDSAERKICLCHKTTPLIRQNSFDNHLNFPWSLTDKLDASQFWITSGAFTTSITIDYYEPERLLLLSNIYVQKSLEANEINFGIDDIQFKVNNNTTPDCIVKKVPKKRNCSQYWFSTGDILMPFEGKQLTAKRIHEFFKYVREFMEATGTLRFGIDSYEFSAIYAQQENFISMQPVSSLKTSDFDHFDVNAELWKIKKPNLS